MPDPKPPTNEIQAFLDLIPTLHIDKLVKLFIKTRDAKADSNREAERKEAEYKLIMETCQNQMLKLAQAQGVTGFKTPFGTTFTAVDTKISIADDSAFFSFVKAEGDLDFFERRVSSRHVEDYMKHHEGAAPPGLNIFRENVMRVRKAQEKTE